MSRHARRWRPRAGSIPFSKHHSSAAVGSFCAHFRAAAIPAVLFYNYLSARVKLFASEMDDFAMEFLNIAERNFT